MTNTIAQSPWKLPVLLSLLLLVPGVGLAAESTSPSSEPLPGTAPSAALHLVEESEKTEPAQHSNPVLRVAAEIGGELATSIVVAYPGAFVGEALCSKFHLSTPNSFLPCLDYAGYGFLVAVSLAAPLGVWAGGTLAGGRGTLLGAYLGMGVAAALGFVATLPIYNNDVRVFVVPLFSVVGAIIGYEVSHSSEVSALDASLARVQPLMTVSAHGGALGLGGRF
ncbi:MAG: hypothetical protein ACJ8AT_37510 [Hyalangium sp.]|uniref:hypothetical protein n=1 Tax=Hyalangium sp. TaxID=2028555 RepID=UPI00389A4BA8